MTKGLFVKLIASLLVISSLWAHANPSCDILAKYDGQYFKTHDDCDQHSYSQIQIHSKMMNENGERFQQTWIHHNNGVGTGGFGIGPTTKINDVFQCTGEHGFASLQDPLGGFYTFTGEQITYVHRGCHSIFQKK